MTATSAGPATGLDVDVQYDVRVPMADGVRLAGNLYLPRSDDPASAYPAILTFIPYHKDGRSGMGAHDAYHRHFASRGYAVLHLDFRGTGSSEGEPYGPFDGRERLDGHQAVEWIARQPWCSGAVGVWGTSYGGITAMAIAETHPPHLRAIVPVHAPEDNYEAMLMHRGSRLMFWPDPHWGANMVASNLMPPLRHDEDGAWLRVWRQRLESPPWILDWHGAPPDPEYWQRQRIDPSRIDVPTFAICGWQDAYPDGMCRIYAALRGPKRLLFGPWKHAFPEQASREPIGILAEIDRWWDRWLKEVDTDAEREPPVTIFVQGIEEWRHEREWPLARATERCLYPQPHRGLAEQPPAGEPGYHDQVFDARVGVAALPYDACTGTIPYPQDQSADDYRSLAYTTPPLDGDLEVTGEPAVRLHFSATAPLEEVNLVAKLCDVAPDGQSFLVTHDNLSAARARQVGEVDGEPVYEATVVLRPTAYVFRAGHRLRLAASGGNFPHVWPTPRRYRLRLYHGAPYGTEVRLPVVPPQEPALPRPALARPLDVKPAALLDSGESYTVHSGMVNRALTVEGRRTSAVQVEPGTKLSTEQHFVMAVDADHPDTANTRTTATWRLERAVGAVRVCVQTVVTLADVQVEAEVDLDGHPYVRRSWHKQRNDGGERDHV